jgi:hypothetical protein
MKRMAESHARRMWANMVWIASAMDCRFHQKRHGMQYKKMDHPEWVIH